MVLNFKIKKNLTAFPFQMDDLERGRSYLTSNEKRIVIRIHQYFFDIWQSKKQHQDLPLRKEVATVFRIGEATVARIVSEYNKDKNDEQLPQKIP